MTELKSRSRLTLSMGKKQNQSRPPILPCQNSAARLVAWRANQRAPNSFLQSVPNGVPLQQENTLSNSAKQCFVTISRDIRVYISRFYFRNVRLILFLVGTVSDGARTLWLLCSWKEVPVWYICYNGEKTQFIHFIYQPVQPVLNTKLWI